MRQLAQQPRDFDRTAALQHIIEGVEPLARFDGVEIRCVFRSNVSHEVRTRPIRHRSTTPSGRQRASADAWAAGSSPAGQSHHCNRRPEEMKTGRDAIASWSGSSGPRRGPDVPTLHVVHQAIVSCERCPAAARVLPSASAARSGARFVTTPTGRGRSRASAIRGARLLILGLAPAAHGANRTGRVFTGDGGGGSGDFLMAALHRAGFANIPTSQHPDDGLELNDAFIAAAVRCAPPDNKPTPEEIANCLPHLEAELDALAPRARRRRARQDRLRRVPAAAEARRRRRAAAAAVRARIDRRACRTARR